MRRGGGSAAFVLLCILTACPRPGSAPPPSDAGVHLPTDGGSADADAGTCQDEDPCTADLRGEAGHCVHPPLPDGTPCDDGSACTTGDTCVSGHCQGTPLPPPHQAAASVWSYGAEPIEDGALPLEGLAEFVADDLLLFGEPLGRGGLSLSLVRLGPEGLQRLDQRQVDIHLERYLGSWDWSDRFVTFLVPLGNGRVVLVGTRQRLELLGVDDGRITSLSSSPLSPASNSILAGVGRGDRFWTCSVNEVTAWRVGPDNALHIEPTQGFALPGSCRSLALSPDGSTLWAATVTGLVPVDVSSETGPVVGPARLSSRLFFHVQLDGTWLVAHELRRYGELGSILVFRLADLEAGPSPLPVASFDPVDTGGLWARPLGFALLEDTLLVEWFRYRGGQRLYEVDRHALEAGGVSAARSTFLLREGEELGLHLTPLTLAGRGPWAVLQPWRRVVALEGADALHFLTGLHHGALERVQVQGDGSVLAVGPFGSHRVDLSSPLSPALTAGAQTLPPDTRRLRLAPAGSASGPLELLTLTARAANVQQEDGATTLSCLRQGAGGLLEPAGDVHLEGGPARLASVPGALFQLAPTAEGTLRLRRFPLPPACTGSVLAHASERTFSLDTSSSGTRTDWNLALDGARAEVLLGEVRSEGSTFLLSLAWGTWEGEGPVATGTLSATTASPTALALSGGRALVVENGRELYVLERVGERIAVRSHVDLSLQPHPVDVSRILAFDREVIWLALSAPTHGVLALRTEAPDQVLATFETAAPVRSLGFSAEHLILGMNGGLTVFTPVCGGLRGAGAGP